MTPMENYLEILGFSSTDSSVYVERARTWILTTLDNDETWFESRTPTQIQRAWFRYRKRVYGH